MESTDAVSSTPPARQPLWRRLLWLVAIWAASVSTVALVAEFIRLLMAAAGMRTC